MRPNPIPTLLATASLLLVACDEDATSPGPRPSHTVELDSIAGYFVPGDTARLTARVRDASGDPIDDAEVAWSSSAPDIAVVDAAGLVAAVATGEAEVVAAVDGASDTTRVTVIPPVLVGAGDIASCDRDGDETTAALLDAIAGVVFTMGDNAYTSGTAREFAECYHPSWGRHRERTRPSPGNHDYLTAGAAAYYSYFGALAGASGKGYYSYDFAGWHVIALNSEIDTSEDSEQVRWLREDLAATSARCVLAYWHKPLFTSGRHGNNPAMRPLWDALYEAGAELVLNGHDHTYERFAPQAPDGTADAERGIRAFVVGTGGRSHYDFVAVQPNSEVRHSGTYGVLKLTLHADGYAWEFVAADGGTFEDAGGAGCR